MKNILIALLLIGTTAVSHAQTTNILHLREGQRHLLSVQTGLEYGFMAGAGYARVIGREHPWLLRAGVSAPFGRQATDDFKTNLGVQKVIYRQGDFAVQAGVDAIFRQYASALVRMSNFGSAFSLTAGYYRPHWFIAGAGAFDKAVTTFIHNKAAMREIYPDVQNGWYIPTGGNYTFGLQTGITLRKTELWLQVGEIAPQGTKGIFGVPFYGMLGVNRRW